MRRILPLLMLVAIAAVADEPRPFSLFARSQHYSMNIDVAGDIYNVTVVDLATNAVVAQPHFVLAGAHTSDISRTSVDDLLIHLYLRRMPNTLSATLEITRGDTVVDSIGTLWTTAPHEKAAGVAGGVIGGVVSTTRPLPAGTYHVGGDVKAPRVITRVEPTYPAEARKAKIAGVVIVEALIDKSGVVRDVQVLKPLPYGLDQAAVDAVKQWRFEPGTKDGNPVDVVFTLTVSYHLDGVKPQP